MKKKNKHFIILMVFFVFSLQAQTSGLKPAAEYLLSNSRTLINAISNCDSLTMKAVGYDCSLNHVKGRVLSLLENNKKEYIEKESEKIVQSYMSDIPWITYAISSSPIISDSITIRFLIKLLQVKKDNDSYSYAGVAYEILKKNTAIEGLLQNKEAIKQAVAASDPQYKDLLVLITTSKEEKKKLLEQNWSIENRACLGDTVALHEMINKYKKLDNYEIKRICAQWLVFTQQPEAIKEVIENINAPFCRIDFDPQPPCTLETLRMSIMSSFTRYFPNEHFLSVDMKSIAYHPELVEDNKYVASLISKFAILIKNKYNIEVPPPQIKYPLGHPRKYFAYHK